MLRISKTAERDAIQTIMNENPPTPAAHAAINCTAAELLKSKVEAAGHLYFDIRPAVEDPAAPGLARWEFIPSESDVHLCDSLHVRRSHAEALFAICEGLSITPAP